MKQTIVSKRSALVVSAVASFLTPFMSSSVSVALPRIAQDFRADAITLSWVSTIYLLAAAMCLVPIGRLADIYGRKRFFLYGVSIYGISTLLSAMAVSPGMLIACRALEGCGGAMISSTSVAILTSVYPPQERGQALGINVATVYMGLSLGPFLGGLLTQHLGWRSIFLATMPLAILIDALALWRLQGEWADCRGEKLDVTGSGVYALALVAIMYGFSRLPGAGGVWLALVGLAGLGAFFWWENRADSPVLNVGLFRRNTVFALSSLAAFLNYSATAAVTFLLSLYLQYIKGLTPQGAGAILVAQPIMQAVFSPLAGRLSDRVQPRIVSSIGMSLTVAGLVLLTFLNEATPVAYIVGSLALLGFGFALFSSPNMNAIMGSVEKRLYGVASGLLSTMRVTGQMFSMGAAMIVFALYIGRTQITPEYYGRLVESARILFGAFAVLCTVGVFASLARGKVVRET